MKIYFTEIDQYFVIIVFVYMLYDRKVSPSGARVTWQFIVEGINLVSNDGVSDRCEGVGAVWLIFTHRIYHLFR